MRKFLSIIIAVSLLFLSSCTSQSQGIIVEESDGYIKIILDHIEGKRKIELKHTNPGECSLYYTTDITEGSINVSYDPGFLWDPLQLFTAASDTNTNGGTYIDSSIKKVTIIIDAPQAASGEILLCFSASASPFT